MASALEAAHPPGAQGEPPMNCAKNVRFTKLASVGTGSVMSKNPRRLTGTGIRMKGEDGSTQSCAPLMVMEDPSPAAASKRNAGAADGSALVNVSPKVELPIFGIAVTPAHTWPWQPAVALPYFVTPVGSMSSIATIPSAAPPFHVSSTVPDVTGKLGDSVSLTTTTLPSAVLARPTELSSVPPSSNGEAPRSVE